MRAKAKRVSPAEEQKWWPALSYDEAVARMRCGSVLMNTAVDWFVTPGAWITPETAAALRERQDVTNFKDDPRWPSRPEVWRMHPQGEQS
jgi:hypothetical protein